MQKPFAGLLSDVLWYVHALDPIGVQKSDTTSEIFEKKDASPNGERPFSQRFRNLCLVPKTGLEPACLSALRPEHSASTNFATWAQIF